MLPVDEKFRPSERLRTNRDFRKVFDRGVGYSGKSLRVIVKINDRKYNRIGIVASRKVGKAFQRNKVKRRIREAFRRSKTVIPQGYDLVVILRTEAVCTKYGLLRDDLIKTVSSAICKCN